MITAGGQNAVACTLAEHPWNQLSKANKTLIKSRILRAFNMNHATINEQKIPLLCSFLHTVPLWHISVSWPVKYYIGLLKPIPMVSGQGLYGQPFGYNLLWKSPKQKLSCSFVLVPWNIPFIQHLVDFFMLVLRIFH